MRFSLSDVKKSIQRRQGELTLSLHLLRANELVQEIKALIAYHERLLGQVQRVFSQDEASTYIGDYRLAHCLLATLSYWYTWQHPDWHEAVDYVSSHNPHPDLLLIPSAVYLRLELYNYVNEHYHGFLEAESRDRALQAFATRYALTSANIEYLLMLDNEDEMRLSRTCETPPSVHEVIARYNQWAFEAALCNASSVHFIIDYNAFAQLSTNNSEATLTTGIGATIKRLCYLARSMGVYYDLAYEKASDGQKSLLSLTLYGPQEVTGVAQRYGIRLARLCRVLLGYAKTHKARSSQLIQAILEASATVYMQQRAYTFRMSADLLRLLPPEEQQDDSSGSPTGAEHEQSTLFDSSIEQSFAEAFAALERSRAVDEWRLEREPEPLLLDGSIFIPDFALTRAQHRIYVEILGFWTPTYRERKIQKLQQLRNRDDLLLAIPMIAKDTYSPILADFPVVFYDEQLSATDILTLLRTNYDDFSTRLAQIDAAMVRKRVLEVGLLPESACLEMLHCYRRSELQQAAPRVTNADIIFTPGIGLYSRTWLTTLKQDVLEWIQDTSYPLGPERTYIVPLANAVAYMRTRDITLQTCDDSFIEAVIELWSDFAIKRDSIFDATLAVTISLVSPSLTDDELDMLTHESKDEQVLSHEPVKPHGQRRPRHAVTHKSARKRLLKEQAEMSQGELW